MCVCAALDAAILNRPMPSFTQPPPGRLNDLVVTVISFVLSVLPWWSPPAPLSDDSDLIDESTPVPLPSDVHVGGANAVMHQ
jgi:hypothetical protein